MRRTLSSSTTFFLKFIFSGVFLSCSAWLIANEVVELFRSPSELSLSATTFILVWSGATTLFCYHLTIPLKRVSVDDHYLYASNYLKEIAIPLSEIAHIRHLRIFNVQPVVIRLNSSGAFGDTIKFVPKTEFGWWWNEHSVVRELKRLIDVQQGMARLFGGAG